MYQAAALKREPVRDGSVQLVQEETEERCDGGLQVLDYLFIKPRNT